MLDRAERYDGSHRRARQGHVDRWRVRVHDLGKHLAAAAGVPGSGRRGIFRVLGRAHQRRKDGGRRRAPGLERKGPGLCIHLERQHLVAADGALGCGRKRGGQLRVLGGRRRQHGAHRGLRCERRQGRGVRLHDERRDVVAADEAAGFRRQGERPVRVFGGPERPPRARRRLRDCRQRRPGGRLRLHEQRRGVVPAETLGPHRRAVVRFRSRAELHGGRRRGLRRVERRRGLPVRTDRHGGGRPRVGPDGHSTLFRSCCWAWRSGRRPVEAVAERPRTRAAASQPPPR